MLDFVDPLGCFLNLVVRELTLGIASHYKITGELEKHHFLELVTVHVSVLWIVALSVLRHSFVMVHESLRKEKCYPDYSISKLTSFPA